ncbi:MAG: AtpZ/AtpI family protein [Acidobacteriota bacterium]|nr:AtpZ/AtpI family protein [Acidobacteriota bacterium]MDH3786297.1 AtpZ/AtpI family protein [Acidobacteriota bacterium]
MDHKSKRKAGKLLFVSGPPVGSAVGRGGVEMEPGHEPPDLLRSSLRFVGAGIEMILPAVLFMYVGHRIDRWLDSEPLGIVLGALMGLVLGFVMFLRTVTRK